MMQLSRFFLFFIILFFLSLAETFASGNADKDSHCDVCGNTACDSVFDVWCFLRKATVPCLTSALLFSAVNEPVQLICMMTHTHSPEIQQQIETAQGTLVNLGYFTPDDFHPVHFNVCKSVRSILQGRAQTFDKSAVSFNGEFPDLSADEQAILMAREMNHVVQLRRDGYSRYACRYGNQVLGGNGFATGNAVEDEALAFADSVRQCLEGGVGCP